jgi:hypothetical protein
MTVVSGQSSANGRGERQIDKTFWVSVLGLIPNNPKSKSGPADDNPKL